MLYSLFQNTFVLKTLKKLEIVEDFFYTIEIVCISHIIPNGTTLEVVILNSEIKIHYFLYFLLV